GRDRTSTRAGNGGICLAVLLSASPVHAVSASIGTSSATKGFIARVHRSDARGSLRPPSSESASGSERRQRERTADPDEKADRVLELVQHVVERGDELLGLGLRGDQRRQDLED